MIQILVWIWSFFRKLGPSESQGLLSDVMLFMCVFVGNKATEERVYGSWSLGIQSTSQPVPTTVEAVSQSGSINLSTYPSKNPLGPLGAKAGYWYERRVPGVTQQTYLAPFTIFTSITTKIYTQLQRYINSCYRKGSKTVHGTQPVSSESRVSWRLRRHAEHDMNTHT